MAKRTVLFLAANPCGTDRRALDLEAHSIRAEIKRSGYRDRFQGAVTADGRRGDGPRWEERQVALFRGKHAPPSRCATGCAVEPEGTAALWSTARDAGKVSLMRRV